MRMHEIISESDWAGDLRNAIIGVISQRMAQDDTSMEMSEMIRALAAQGFRLNSGQVIAAVDSSGYASNVTDEEITFMGNIGDEFAASSTADDLSTIADREASSSINKN
jgi:hypothetical protein